MHRFKYLACALALATVACGSSDDALTTPSTTNNLTIDFTDATNGPITPHGSQTFQFATLTAGTVTVQLISLNPDGLTAAVGLELGVYDSLGACQRVVHNDHVTISNLVTGTATAAGNLCASIYDSTGSLPGPETFDIQVSHP